MGGAIGVCLVVVVAVVVPEEVVGTVVVPEEVVGTVVGTC